MLKLLGLFLISLASVAASAAPQYPKLFFQYSFLYDKICSPEKPVNPAYAKEATDREKEFAALWEADAPVLFGQLFDEFGKGMSRKEVTATLSACAPKSGSSYSYPLVLNVSRYLKSYMSDQGQPVRENFKFVNTTFHELVHTWVNDNLDKKNSALLAKYKDEDSSVKSHLHLMALQILVYKNLGRSDWLKWLDEDYKNRPEAPVYPRAWEIVTTLEGHEAFIAEFKR